MYFICLLSQLSQNLKGVLSPNEIQKLQSIRLYSKVISTGSSAIELSVTSALSKTLGPELESLSNLNLYERFNYLRSLKAKVMAEKFVGSLSSKSKILFDPFEMNKYRKSLSLQTRSIMVATSLFLPHTFVVGIPISLVNINFILESCKFLWDFWGLDVSEFEFSLQKEAAVYSNNSNLIDPSMNILDAVKILVFSELKGVVFFSKELDFTDDLIALKSENNLTLLESDLGFIKRNFPKLPAEFFISDFNLKDDLLRQSLDQRKLDCFRVTNFYKYL